MKIAIFTSANSSYVPKAAVALLSFRRWHPEFDYFVLGTKARMHPKTLTLLEDYEIELIDVGESRRLVRKEELVQKALPVETFYLLNGPELLAERGFDYSISIDGDVFCYRPLQLDSVLHLVQGFAGRPV